MASLSLSASAPDILNENESQKIIGKRKSSVRISLAQNKCKKSDIASIAEAEDFGLTDYEEEHVAEHQSFINLESIKQLVSYSTTDSSYLSQNEKNSR